ncbi:hypothetical protein BU24DRAFT_428796 [Aaosphaeria arxii CBS 175.79]|uniref:F-box domain-containing protein n=1 Tax=Aaosphaeria arxii CBS 175.79 TaxID=1450172 RepID=A0A6A5X8M5_9PLEO|nr:uncharacterized protein BU24DRAFT_428796 [Aaosphaeria arxii CBS 175.79]KAF2009249.1 hypothetical protein BU24DRAFT_428796 [Aaosphaeria arxii CBS 175.79]
MDILKANLAALPAEVLESVARNLQLSELRCLRLTSKALEVKSSYHFGRTHFATVTTNMSFASIQKLESLSKSTWAVHIKVFRLDWDEEAGHGLIWGRERKPSKAILSSLPVMQQVRDIILRFINCRSICITTPYEHDHMFCPRVDMLGCSDLLGLCFILVAETGLALETFRLEMGSNSKDRVKNGLIHMEQIERPTFRKTFSELKELSLRLSVDDTPCDWVWKLVSEAVQLRKLDFDVTIFEPFYFEPLSLSHVRELSFSYMKISEANLTTLLQRCRHCLRSLKLFGTRLDQSWRGILRFLQNFHDLERISFHFLRVYRGTLPCAFNSLGDSVVGSSPSNPKLQLRRKGPSGRQRIVGVDYSGPSMRRVLEMLENAIDL